MNIKPIISSLFKAFALSVALTVLFPSFVKLSHAFTHHSHKVCDEDAKHDTHFHESDLDCDFYKFKLTNSQFLNIYEYQEDLNNDISELQSFYYSSYHTQNRTYSFLRGPPLFV